MCQEHSISHPQKPTEVKPECIFDMWPGKVVHTDFGTFDGVDYLIITDKLIGYLSVTRTRDKSAEQAVLALRGWSAK